MSRTDNRQGCVNLVNLVKLVNADRAKIIFFENFCNKIWKK